MAHYARVAFLVRGRSFSPDEFSAAVGIHPSRTSVAGWKDAATNTPTHSVWVVEVRHEGGYIDLGQSIVDLVAALESKAEIIYQTASEMGAECLLSVVLKISSDQSLPTPSLTLDNRVMSFLLLVHARFDVDLYRKE